MSKPFAPDYGSAHRLDAPMRPGSDHPIWTLDVATLDYVIESLVGIWAVEPDLLIDSAIADVRAIRGYANSSASRSIRDIDTDRDISHETDDA